MLKQTPSIIYRADLRKVMNTDLYKSFSTFNSGQEEKIFGDILTFNEIYLGPGKQAEIFTKRDTTNIILPLTGSIEYPKQKASQLLSELPQLLLLNENAGAIYLVKNPHESDWAAFLQIELEIDIIIPDIYSYNIDLFKRNELLSLGLDKYFKGRIPAFAGVFDGRKEGCYELSDRQHGVFVFIINGTFEVQNRLLERGDALALWNIDEVEFESLSIDSAILFIETSLK